MRKLKSVTAACEAFYAGIFCGGNVAQARGLMLPQKTDERIDLAQFQVSQTGEMCRFMIGGGDGDGAVLVVVAAVVAAVVRFCEVLFLWGW